MQQTIELKAEIRNQKGKGCARKIRRTGNIPAILYGKGRENLLLSVNTAAVDKILRGKLGKNVLINLAVDDDSRHQVMIKDYQGDVLTRALTHVDFLAVDADKELIIFVPIKITGKAEGVTKGGLLDQISRQVELVCRADRIPEEIVVDVTKLEIGQNIHLADVALPEGASLRAHYNPTIVTVSAPRAEEVVAAVAAAPTEAGAAAPAEGAAGKEAAAPKDAKAGAAKDAKAAAPVKASAKAPAKEEKKK